MFKWDKKYRYALLGVALAIVGFVGGLFLGAPKNDDLPEQTAENPQPPAVQISSPATPEVELPTPTPYVGIYYFLQVEENELRLYVVDGENKTLVKRAEVQLDMFPASDRAMLEKGLKLSNLEESIQYFEDFTS